jgi:hypothetical protein
VTEDKECHVIEGKEGHVISDEMNVDDSVGQSNIIYFAVFFVHGISNCLPTHDILTPLTIISPSILTPIYLTSYILDNGVKKVIKSQFVIY